MFGKNYHVTESMLKRGFYFFEFFGIFQKFLRLIIFDDLKYIWNWEKIYHW